MSFSFNPSIWFVCKLCRRIFPNTDKLKRHKLDYHLEECTKIKCIIFEERCLYQEWHPYQTNCSTEGDQLEQDTFYPAEENYDPKNIHDASTANNSSHSQSPSKPIKDIKVLRPNLSRKNPYVLLERLTAKQLPSEAINSNITAAPSLKKKPRNQKRFSTSASSAGNQRVRKRSSFQLQDKDSPQKKRVDRNTEKDFKLNFNLKPHREITSDSQSRTKLNTQLSKPESSTFSQSQLQPEGQQEVENVGELEQEYFTYSPPIPDDFSQDSNRDGEFSEEFGVADQQEDEEKMQSDISLAGGVEDESMDSELVSQAPGKKLNRKRKTLSSKKTFTCPHCPSTFNFRQNLHRHLILHGRRTKYQCSFCGKCFHNNPTMERHERTHTGDRPFKCHVAECSYSFCSKDGLDMHLREKHCKELGLEEFLCSFCGQAFGRMATLNYHITANHSSNRPFKCTHEGCKADFKFKNHLINHMRDHQRGSLHKCNYCKRSFRDLSTLEAHEKTHFMDKPFKCDVPSCKLSFKSKDSLSSHIMAKHSLELGMQQFVCTVCNASFGLQCRLDYHFRDKHCDDKPFTCEYEGCEKAYKFNNLLRRHMKVHTKT